MPQFTLHRNYILRTLFGHTLKFEKGVPVDVPQICVADVIAIGAIPVEGMESVDPEEPAAVILTPAQRKAALFAAFETMAKRGDRMDYTASGMPNAKRLPALCGFEVTLSERDIAWNEFKVLAQENKAQHALDARLDRVG